MRSKIVVIMLLALTIVLCSCGNSSFKIDGEMIKYDGDTYVPLQYNDDLFYYYYNGSWEEDEFSEIENSQWKMICHSGDLYCVSEAQNTAVSYYANDGNYDWYVIIDDNENEQKYSLQITSPELEYVYGMENMAHEKSIFVDEIEKFASLIKISKDGIVEAKTELALYEGKWYWRSEIIDESREQDDTWPEYVQALPDSLNDKLQDL